MARQASTMNPSMKTQFLLFVAFYCLGSLLHLQAQQPETKPDTKPGHSLGMVYPDTTYRNDRKGTGPYFREIRKVRQERGIEAGIAEIGPSFTTFRKQLHSGWNDRQAFDEWGFWVWHEAQFDSGKNDPEWSIALYRWIFDEARRINRMDWVFHVSSSVLGAYAGSSRWTAYRQVLGEMKTYLEQQGFHLDTLRLPDRGQWDNEVPGVRMREFPVKIPNSRHVVAWQRYEQRDPSKPTWMDKGTANHMLLGAQEQLTQGDWRINIELGLWVCAVVDAIIEFNHGKPEKEWVKREEEQMYLDAVQRISDSLDLLGLGEAEERLITRALEKKLHSRLDGSMARNSLRIRLLQLRIQKGDASEAMLKELDGIIALKDGLTSQNELGVVGARLAKAKCLKAMGRENDALALLAELRKLTARKYNSWLGVELTHVNWCLERGDLAEAGSLLPELLEQVRKDGLKISELYLYESYVKWAELSGDLGLAVLCQRELLRLLEVFSITPRIPLAQATLARLLGLIGEKEESASRIARALALAEMPNLPHRIIDSVRGTAAELAGAGSKDSRKGRVLLQPGTALSEAAAGFPARLMLQVVNVGEGQAAGILRISGVASHLKWDPKSRLGSLECLEGAGQRQVAVEVEAQSMALFQCAANKIPDEGLTLKAEWIEEGNVLETAQWTIKPADNTTSSAVIDAGIYRTDGFCMIPVYHHLQSRDRSPANLRVIASVPCRVEMYDESGQLRLVDATGNGSCLDSGDWLREDADGNHAVELTPTAATGETNFHLFVDPHEAIPAEGIILKIEWLIDGKWSLAAEDRIMGN
jgi:tetratricopeptide (TPR) repeat protein